MTQSEVKKSLIEQLRQQGRETPYTLALVDDYMQHYKYIRQFRKDVAKRGVKVTHINTKGFEVIQDNESLKSIRDEQITMLKMLQALRLQDPVKAESNDDYL